MPYRLLLFSSETDLESESVNVDRLWSVLLCVCVSSDMPHDTELPNYIYVAGIYISHLVL